MVGMFRHAVVVTPAFAGACPAASLLADSLAAASLAAAATLAGARR
jgi:hypothetical protein